MSPPGRRDVDPRAAAAIAAATVEVAEHARLHDVSPERATRALGRLADAAAGLGPDLPAADLAAIEHLADSTRRMALHLVDLAAARRRRERETGR